METLTLICIRSEHQGQRSVEVARREFAGREAAIQWMQSKAAALTARGQNALFMADQDLLIVWHSPTLYDFYRFTDESLERLAA